MRKAWISTNILDLLTGMLVYTYGVPPSVDISIPRPEGFIVSELLGILDAERLFHEIKDRVREVSAAFLNVSSATYIVEKIGIDTLTLCRELEKQLRCHSCVPLGLKEANAITYQFIVLRNCTELTQYVEAPNFRAVLWSYETTLPKHTANRFKIRIHATLVDTLVERLRIVQQYGYVLNFYGYQRFGTRRPITHIAGKMLLLRDWENFLSVLCSGKWWRYTYPESYICRLVGKEAPLDLIKRIRREYLILYLNAYQAYLFNTLLSKIWLETLEECHFDLSSAIDKLSNALIPVPGLGASFQGSRWGSDLRMLLELEGVDLNDFKITELRISLRGDLRPALARIEDLVWRVRANELHLEFVLPRGGYATVLLRELSSIDPIRFT